MVYARGSAHFSAHAREAQKGHDHAEEVAEEEDSHLR